jgi:hypothetical protein
MTVHFNTKKNKRNIQMKTLSVSVLLLAGSAFAETKDPTKAIEFLQELQANKPPFNIEAQDEGLRNVPPSLKMSKLGLGDWVKYHAGESFKFKVVHNMQPMDGFNFEVTQAICQLAHVTPSGIDFGSENLEGGWKPAISYGQTASMESNKKACVNGFVCSYEVVIKEIADSPDGRFKFGPYALAGNKGPLYDCFLEVTDKLE